MNEGQIIAAIIAVAGLAVTIGINAVATLLRIYKSPKEDTADLAERVREDIRDVKAQVGKVRDDVEEIRDEHHDLAIEVARSTTQMKSLGEDMRDLKVGMERLTQALGVAYGKQRNGRV